jgi:uncharacterized protein YndB with AHSA1/START domain
MDQRMNGIATASQFRPSAPGATRGAAHVAALRLTQCYEAQPERVFDAWLDPAVAARWLFATAAAPISHVTLDARVAGSFRFVDRRRNAIVEHAGRYLEIVRPRCLRFTLTMENIHVVTTVSVTITPLDGGCTLALSHAGVPLAVASYAEARWAGMLYGLGEILNTTGSVPGTL